MQEAPASPDLPTIASVAIVAYAVSAVTHEGIGHGLVATLMGGKVYVVGWIVLAVTTIILFVGVLGPGVRFARRASERRARLQVEVPTPVPDHLRHIKYEGP
jgi:hypothetical protein